MESVPGWASGQLLLALDRTMVTLVDAPRGLDMPVGSVALVDADDVRLGVAAGAGSADAFFLLGVSDADALSWLECHDQKVPAAIFVKEPTEALVARPSAAGAAVVAVEPRARWERLYRLVTHVARTPRRPRRPPTRIPAPTFSGSRSRSPNGPTG